MKSCMRSALCRAWLIVNLKNYRLLKLNKVPSGSCKALQNLDSEACDVYLLWCFILFIPHFDSGELTVSS